MLELSPTATLEIRGLNCWWSSIWFLGMRLDLLHRLVLESHLPPAGLILQPPFHPGVCAGGGFLGVCIQIILIPSAGSCVYRSDLPGVSWISRGGESLSMVLPTRKLWVISTVMTLPTATGLGSVDRKVHSATGCAPTSRFHSVANQRMLPTGA